MHVLMLLSLLFFWALLFFWIPFFAVCAYFPEKSSALVWAFLVSQVSVPLLSSPGLFFSAPLPPDNFSGRNDQRWGDMVKGTSP